MSEVCHTEAKTIHRLLEVEPGADEVGSRLRAMPAIPLECDVLIVDEMSMVDILLMHSLLLALPRSARLIMVGDSDQLPSVGAGNVLRDIIESGTLSCIQLTEIFRQAKESMIVVNAHRINHGEMPLLNDRDNRLFFVRRSDPLSLCETIADLCQRAAALLLWHRQHFPDTGAYPTRKNGGRCAVPQSSTAREAEPS